MLHAISSQIIILVAGLQRLEGQQRHPQPPPSTTSTGRATAAATPTIIDTFVRAGHIGPTRLSDGTSHSCGHLRQPDGAHCSCSYVECQHFPRTQTEKKVQTPGTSSASVTQPQSPQASSWPPCQRWFHVSPSRLHSKAPTGSQGHAGAPTVWSFIRPLTDYQRQKVLSVSMYACFANMRFMLSRSLSCEVCPCSDLICHAVVSGVRKQPGGGTQCPRITSSDCSAP